MSLCSLTHRRAVPFAPTLLMMRMNTTSRKVANSLLAALPGKNYRRLRSGLEQVELEFGDVLYEAGQKIRHVYFPGNSLVSLLTRKSIRLNSSHEWISR